VLFNSHLFIFGFLPVALAVYWWLRARGLARAALGWLLAASLAYYGWWEPRYLALILASIGINYALGRVLERRRGSRALVVAGVALNLGALAWFKYAGFLLETVNALAGLDARIGAIVLPLAISFFTFQQLSYLVDVHRGEPAERDLLHYALFVAFFPQLIAGPIVRQQELAPQFRDDAPPAPVRALLAAGLSLFLLGLFKKTVLADGVAAYATPVFEAADRGATITFFESWGGALAYTFQLYLDFSGYCDMAMGLAWCFGYRLPVNFDAPYQATGIIDFWRRWHLTLSRFLRDYLYIPLGGNRRGPARHSLNLLLVMTLGGLWHGAGWNFVLWGFVHGVLLLGNLAWRRLRARWTTSPAPRWEVAAGSLLTFALVVVARDLFRADTLAGAVAMLRGAVGLEGAVLDARLAGPLGFLSPWVTFTGLHAGSFDLHGVPWLIALWIVCRHLPDTPRLFAWTGLALDLRGADHGDARATWRPVTGRLPAWRPDTRWALAVATLGAVAVVQLSRVMEFLYYRF
jgi:D-alanyl-lipoteichoic acid acyltransferase DltB (MBOAT superfamily)